MRKQFINIAALTVLFLSLPASAQMMDMMRGGGMMNGSMIRHRYVMHNGLGSRYASLANPLKPSARNIADGIRLYGQNCAMCHGKTGLGDGDSGKSLDPPPSDLAALVSMPIATDGYLYWSIAEGGKQLGTGMPAYRDTLKTDEIWKIIIYLRGF
jgi:mono/diheme cytochrome c family protein